MPGIWEPNIWVSGVWTEGGLPDADTVDCARYYYYLPQDTKLLSPEKSNVKLEELTLDQQFVKLVKNVKIQQKGESA
jgi:hypothetical protein